MIPTIAQITSHTPPSGFGEFVSNAFYIVGLITAGVVLFKHIRPKPPQTVDVHNKPLVVSAHRKFVEEERFNQELKEVHGRLSRERKELDQQITEIRREHKEEISAANKRFENITNRLDELRDDISDAPTKTVELLQRTKGLL